MTNPIPTETLLLIAGTIDLWLPPVKLLAGQIAATKPGIQITDAFKSKLSWMNDKTGQKEFENALKVGLQEYDNRKGNTAIGRIITQVFKQFSEIDKEGRDRAIILHQIFASNPTPSDLASLASRYIWVFSDSSFSDDDIAGELEFLIMQCLRPAFMQNAYFTDRVGFAEITRLLHELIQVNKVDTPDLKKMREDYAEKITNNYSLIAMRGISPKIHNRTIGIPMDQVFIPLEAKPQDVKSFLACLREDDYLSEELTDHISKLKDMATLPTHLSSDSSELIGKSIRILSSKRERRKGKFRSRFKSVGNRTFGRFSRSSDTNVHSLELDRILQIPRFVVQGDPGSGKSTLAKYLSWAIASKSDLATSLHIDNRIPVLIRAIEFGEALSDGRVNTLAEYLVYIDSTYSALHKYALVSGLAFVFIDGLDEVGDAATRRRVQEKVDEFVADPIFEDCKIIVTTRIIGYQRSGLVGDLPHFTLVELDDKQISNFVTSWYNVINDEIANSMDIESEKQQLMEAITQIDGIHRMARNPLLLTIIALIKWQGSSLPDQRVLLYDIATATLIKSWPDSHRGVKLNDHHIREWLAPVGVKVLTDGKSDMIAESELMNQLVDSMKRLKPITEFEARVSSEDLLENVSHHSGILLPRGQDKDGRELYGFLHRTFAEYLAAKYFIGLWKKTNLH